MSAKRITRPSLSSCNSREALKNRFFLFSSYTLMLCYNYSYCFVLGRIVVASISVEANPSNHHSGQMYVNYTAPGKM